MLNELEKTLERKVPGSDRRWQVAEDPLTYDVSNELHLDGWPIHTDTES